MRPPANNDDMSNLQKLYLEGHEWSANELEKFKKASDKKKTSGAETTFHPDSREKARMDKAAGGYKVKNVKVDVEEEQAPPQVGIPGHQQPNQMPQDASASPLGQYAQIVASWQNGDIDEPTAEAQLQALGQQATELTQQPAPVAQVPTLEEEGEPDDEDDEDDDGRDLRDVWQQTQDEEMEELEEDKDPRAALGGPAGHLSQNVNPPSFNIG